MALGEIIFHDAVRANAAPCAHFELQIILSDGSQRTHDITFQELQTLVDSISKVIGEGSGAAEIALAVLWVWFQQQAGATIPEMRDAVIAGPV